MRLGIHPGAAWRVIDGHVFVITSDNRQHELSGEVELLVWRLCDGAPRTVADLAAAIVAEFDVTEAEASADLRKFVDELLEARVLTQLPD